MERIKAHRVSATVKERAEMDDTEFELTGSYMQLFGVHIDTNCLHRMQVSDNHENQV